MHKPCSVYLVRQGQTRRYLKRDDKLRVNQSGCSFIYLFKKNISSECLPAASFY